MIQTIEIPLPPTLNDQIELARTHWSKSSAAKKRHTAKVAKAAKSLIRYPKPPIYVVFHWYVKNFGRDADNIAAAAKYIMDGLVAAKVIPDDNLVKIPGPYVHEFFRGNDTVKVMISDSPIVELYYIQQLQQN